MAFVVLAFVFSTKNTAFAQSDTSKNMIGIDRLSILNNYSILTGGGNWTNRTGILNSSILVGINTKYGYGLDGALTYNTNPFLQQPVLFSLRLRDHPSLNLNKLKQDSLQLLSLNNDFDLKLNELMQTNKLIDSINFSEKLNLKELDSLYLPYSDSLESRMPDSAQLQQADTLYSSKIDSLQHVSDSLKSEVIAIQEQIQGLKEKIRKVKESEPLIKAENIAIGRIVFQDELFNNAPIALNGASGKLKFRGGLFITALYGKNSINFFDSRQSFSASKYGTGWEFKANSIEVGTIGLKATEAFRWYYARWQYQGKKFSTTNIVYYRHHNTTSNLAYRLVNESAYNLNDYLTLLGGICFTSPQMSFTGLPGIVNASPLNSYQAGFKFKKKKILLESSYENRQRKTENFITTTDRYKVRFKYKASKKLSFFSLNTLLDNRSKSTIGTFEWRGYFFLSSSNLTYKLSKKLTSQITYNAIVNRSLSSSSASTIYRQTGTLNLISILGKVSMTNSLGFLSVFGNTHLTKELTLSFMAKKYSLNGNIYHDKVSGLRYSGGIQYSHKRIAASIQAMSFQTGIVQPTESLPISTQNIFSVNISLNIKIL